MHMVLKTTGWESINSNLEAERSRTLKTEMSTRSSTARISPTDKLLFNLLSYFNVPSKIL